MSWTYVSLFFLINAFNSMILSTSSLDCNCGPNFAHVGSRSVNGSRIINGREAIPHKYPWLVSLGMRAKNGKIYHFCGGTLINEQWVLTAAHCLSIEQDKIVVSLGAHQLSAPHEKYSVIEKIVHPLYVEQPVVYNDVGMVKLNVSVTFNNLVRAGCLVRTARLPYDELVVSGWGVINETSSERTDVPMEASLVHTTHVSCSSQWFGLLSYFAHICGFKAGQSACFGDSGSALMVVRRNLMPVIGVVSFGSGCHSEKPTVFAKVATYVDWIKGHAGEVCEYTIGLSSRGTGNQSASISPVGKIFGTDKGNTLSGTKTLL